MGILTHLKRSLYTNKTISLIRGFFIKYYNYIQYFKWEFSNTNGPTPFLYKKQLIEYYAKRNNIKILVETGTFYGDMIDATKNKFAEIYSIELGLDLYNKALWRFSKNLKIHLINGDSALELKKLIPKLSEPAIFWLDAHYSGGVTAGNPEMPPIIEELTAIAKSNFDNIILINDARRFGVLNSYPNIEKIIKFVSKNIKGAKTSVSNDIIRITK